MVRTSGGIGAVLPGAVAENGRTGAPSEMYQYHGRLFDEPMAPPSKRPKSKDEMTGSNSALQRGVFKQ